jgi:phage gp29-like protein
MGDDAGMTECRPVGSALPPRRDAMLVEARDAMMTTPGESIVVPLAQDRMLEFFERDWVPAEVKNSVGSAIFGDLESQQRLFQAMIDTWPHLQKALREIKLAARNAPWKVVPWAPRGEEADEASQALASEVEDAIWSMRPDALRNYRGFEGTIEAMVEGYFVGHQVIEPLWERRQGAWRPVAAKVVPPRFYSYANTTEGEDRLMFDRGGRSAGTWSLEDFPPHRFLFAVNGGHTGHPAAAAPLRALTPYWMAAVYGLRWAMVYSQLFGIPFRWATYADDADKTAVSRMLANIGTAGWAAFKKGTELNLVESSKGTQQLPQWELMEMANRECDVFILGQTLTTDVGNSGSRALGDVHDAVRRGVIAGVCDFVGEILTHQLVPAFVHWNYGDGRTDLPGIWARFDEAKDEKAMAERDEVLRRAFPGLEWSMQQIRERHGIDAPQDDEDTFRQGPNGAVGDPPTGDEPAPHETKARLEAADAGDGELSTPDKLSAAVLEGLTGVSRQWLGPVRPFFDRLAALAMSRTVTDEDFMAALERARAELPELFEVLDTQALEEAFEEAIGSAMLAGSTEGL